MEKLEIIKNKIIAIDKIHSLLAIWRFQSKKIVFTNGCFDLLHMGHVVYLSKAADLGQVLIVGLNSDVSVKKIKGEQRPIIDQQSRSIVLASLSFVTTIILFDDETPYELIKTIQPDVLVKGSDYAPDEIIGADIVKARGGQIHTIQLVEGYSTTQIKNKIFFEKK